MATFQVTIDDAIQQEADRLFAGLGIDMATAIQLFLKASIENAGMPFPVRHDSLTSDLLEAVTDTRERRNLHGPYSSAREAVASMLED